MKHVIEKLNNISSKKSRRILGLMSGTSMDGIDIALCSINGASLETHLIVEKFATIKVSDDIRKLFFELAFNPEAFSGKILRYQAELNREWVRVITDQIREWNFMPGDLDLIASHGQTILHQPDPENNLHSTWQLVDGDYLARNLEVITISDFRQKHIAIGYEGAPLAPLAEALIFHDPVEDRLLLNLGGIANFTFLKGGLKEPRIPFATDTGPANTLLDAAVQHLMPGHQFDENGKLAMSGRIDQTLLNELLKHPFFSRPFPKSTGQEDFNWQWLHELVLKISPDLNIADLLSTLTEFTVRSVADAIHKNFPDLSNSVKIYVSGGGWNNEYLVDRLRSQLPETEICSSSDLGLQPEAKEAALFAVLANETVAGEGWLNQDGARFTLGKISLP
jgi:anhydro-N-acetylmuramic acid kinase